MEMKYKIIGLDKFTGTLTIFYYSDDYPQGMLFNLDLPIDHETNTTLSGTALADFILLNAPRQQMAWAIEKQRAISLTDFSHIESLIESIPAQDNPLVAAGVTTIDSTRI